MDFVTLVPAVLILLWGCFHLLRRRGKLPPGPFQFPIIGNAFQIAKNPHESLVKLSKTYGQLMSLKLGSKYTVVASSPEMAKEILQTNDRVFSGRPTSVAIRSYDHHMFSLAFLPAGNRWSKLRKICREHMFSRHQLDASHCLRQEKLQKLHDYVHECSARGRVVNVGDAAFVTSLNLISVTLFSVDFCDFDDSDVTQEVKECLQGMGKIVTTPNLADFFPVLQMIDPQGIKREAEFYTGKLVGIIGDVINQRLEPRGASSHEKKSEMLEALLDLREGNKYDLSLEEMMHLFGILVFAGAGTSSTTVDWTITELIMNPEKMNKATNEVRKVIGKNKLVEESKISRFPYLQAVIKETFRYHPVSLLLVPHKAEEEAKINGYKIPKTTQILVNVWAMGRDSSVWKNANVYEPERFLNNKIDFKGKDFALIPFGSGRRICHLKFSGRLSSSSLTTKFPESRRCATGFCTVADALDAQTVPFVLFRRIKIPGWITFSTPELSERGESLFATQTTALSVTFLNQRPTYLLLEFSGLKNPSSNFPPDETRVSPLLCFDKHLLNLLRRKCEKSGERLGAAWLG